MPYYKKKPVIIEAHLLLHGGNANRIADWCGGLVHQLGVDIPTMEGVMLASWGDYVIKGVSGEFYPCKPDIFAQTYEEVNV